MAEWSELKRLAERLSACPAGYTMHAETVRQVMAGVLALIAENERLGERLALVDLVHGRKAEERWTNLNALCGERLAALQRVRNRLQLAGATLPAPDPMGTPESGLVQGLCIALALVEEGLPKPVVSTLYTRLREKLSKGGQGNG